MEKLAALMFSVLVIKKRLAHYLGEYHLMIESAALLVAIIGLSSQFWQCFSCSINYLPMSFPRKKKRPKYRH